MGVRALQGVPGQPDAVAGDLSGGTAGFPVDGRGIQRAERIANCQQLGAGLHDYGLGQLCAGGGKPDPDSAIGRLENHGKLLADDRHPVEPETTVENLSLWDLVYYRSQRVFSDAKWILSVIGSGYMAQIIKVLLGVVLCMPLLAYASVTNNIFLNQIEKHSDSFVIGKSGPVFTEFFDPDCPYCHFLYEAMAPYVKAGIVRVREVPLAVIDPNSLRRSAFLLQSKHPGTVLSKGEVGYRYGHLAIPLANKISAGLQARLDDNARILGLGDSMGGIPFLVFQNKKAGKVGAMVGLPSPYALRQAIREAGGNVHAVPVSGNGVNDTLQSCLVPAR